MLGVVQAVCVRRGHGVEELAVLASRHVVLAHLVGVADRAVAGRSQSTSPLYPPHCPDRPR